MYSFGEYLKRVRKDKKVTMRELSRQSGVSHPYISQLESGECNNPSLLTVIKLLKSLDVGVIDYLVESGYITKDDVINYCEVFNND